MSDNQHNIEEIQAYLNGKLDAKAMHRLERDAQDDPFLMDAIEGYQNTGTDQRSNYEDVKVRFAERTEEKKERNIILWRILPIAASLLIVLGIGFLWLKPKGEQAPLFTQSVIAPKHETAKMVVAPKMINPVISHLDTANRLLSPRIQKLLRNGFIVSTAGSLKKVSKIRNRPATIQPTLAQVLANRAQSLDITSTSTVPQTSKNQAITGKVVDATGHSLAGVNISIKGSALKAVTDTNGVFNITANDSLAILNVAHTGYDSKHVSVNGKSQLSIILNESTNVLAQVSVAGYSKDSLNLGIHPLAGWKAFTAYIRNNAFMPDGETGRVKLAFTVDVNGAIKGIRIIRHGKSEAMNQKAIALLMNGPQWMGSSDAKEMKLKIRFRKMKT